MVVWRDEPAHERADGPGTAERRRAHGPGAGGGPGRLRRPGRPPQGRRGELSRPAHRRPRPRRGPGPGDLPAPVPLRPRLQRAGLPAGLPLPHRHQPGALGGAARAAAAVADAVLPARGARGAGGARRAAAPGAPPGDGRGDGEAAAALPGAARPARDRGLVLRRHRPGDRVPGGHREVARPSRTPAVEAEARALLDWRCGMEDDRTRQITDLLRELPAEHARPGFTARVLERLDAPPRTAPRRGFPLALAPARGSPAAIRAPGER